MPRFRFIGAKHADELASGRPLALGDEVDLKGEELEANRRLVTEGLLLELPGKSSKHKKPKEEGDK